MALFTFFSDWSEPFFVYPLAYKLGPQGIGISYPQIRGTEKTDQSLFCRAYMRFIRHRDFEKILEALKADKYLMCTQSTPV